MKWWEWVGLLLIVALAAWLRLAHGAATPGWFSDEGTHLAIARHLQYGRWQYLAVTDSTLLFARPPLFEWLLAGAVRLFGLSMGTLRGLTGALGTATVLLLFALARQAGQRRAPALLAAGTLAVYPPAVLYSRFGFSYNLLAALLLLALWGLLVYWRGNGRWGLALACAAVGVGAISDVMGLLFLPLPLLAAAWRRPRDLPWAAPLALLPLAAWTAVSLLTAPQPFLFDLRFTFGRVSLPPAAQLRQLADNGLALLGNGWTALGLAGLWVIRPLLLRRLALLFLLPLLAVARTAALYSLSAYYLIPFLPLLALGVAALLPAGAAAVMASLGLGRLKRKTAVWPALAMLLAAAPLALPAWSQGQQTRAGFITPVDPFLQQGADVTAAAAYVNAHSSGDDLVIASPAVAWLLQANAADFQMAAAAAGQATPHLPPDLPAERFAFWPDYRQAQMVVIDNLWHNWARFHVPGVAAMMDEVMTWPQVFAAGDVVVYRREVSE